MTYGYDDDGRLSSVTSGGQTSTYGYDAAGDETSLVLPAGSGYTESRSYDRAGRVSEVKDANGSSTLSQFDYVYDGDGDATKITTLSGEQDYSYDDLGRLTEVCYQATACAASDPHISYGYDLVGNRLSESSDTGSTTYAYNADDELTSATDGGGTTDYAYDARGDEVQAGSRTFSFDLSERMSSTTDGGATTTFTYDGDGNRLSASDGTSTTDYGWDTNWALPELVSESQGGSELRGYVYGSRVLSMSEGGGSYYFHSDRLGSIVAVTSDGGQTEWQYSYDPFGNIRSQTEATGAPANPLGFVGQLTDASTGLYDMRARMYDPTLGRFTGTDPDPAGAAVPAIEAYDYAGQDPVRNLDPNGERLFAEGGLEPGISTSCGKYGGQSCAGTEGNAEEPIEQTVDLSMKEVRSAVTKVALSVVNNPDLQLAALTCVGMAVKTEGPPIAKGAACVVSGATVYFFGVNLLEPASADSSEGKRRPGRAGWKPLP